jgi:hypothetical protein
MPPRSDSSSRTDDHGQIYIGSSAAVQDDENNPYIAAFVDATESARFIGVRPGLIDPLTPGQWNGGVPGAV